MVVACSGGRDSVVLAHATATLLGARRVVLGHVDHGVRAGSALDARFVEALAKELGSAYVGVRVAPRSDAEAELRRVRYEALEQIRLEQEASLVLTAHTEDDQAETVLLQLIRSTELRGLTGIARRVGCVVRPLLDVPRSEIATYADRYRLEWREDPSNLEPRYLRNRIRKELLPLLERRYRPRITGRLARMVRTEKERSAVVAGVRVESTTKSPPPSDAVAASLVDWTGGTPPDGRARAAFDAAELRQPAVRRVRPGDRIQPFGMTGRTKVTEVLRAAGIPAHLRRDVLVLVDAEDRVVWVPGVLRSAAAPIQPETTRAWLFELRETSVLQATESQVTLEAGEEGAGETPSLQTRNDS